MIYVLQKVYCTTLQASATKKVTPSYIKEFAKQLLENTTQTIKSLLTFQHTKTMQKFLSNIGRLKQSSLTRKNHGKSKGDAISTIPFPEDVTCA